jgi:hypothetical protein
MLGTSSINGGDPAADASFPAERKYPAHNRAGLARTLAPHLPFANGEAAAAELNAGQLARDGQQRRGHASDNSRFRQGMGREAILLTQLTPRESRSHRVSLNGADRVASTV